MIKMFVTGDNHFGKKYDRYPEIKDKLIQSRFDTFEDMIRKAEDTECDFFVITGDLFDNIYGISASDVKKVVDIMSHFSSRVIVLPGNHDYFTGEEKVWKEFEKELSTRDHNIILIKEFKPYTFITQEETVIFYPAFCQSKHSKENNLGWIKSAEIQKNSVINIGLAHGAIQGITPDINEEYFLMTENELLNIPVDAWLIGHTHIPYPNSLKEDSDSVGYIIFNAGTHEQTDLHNNSDGNGFIITIEKEGTASKVSARKYISGRVHFYDIDICVKPDNNTSLSDAIKKEIAEKNRNSVIRIHISGSVKQEEYQSKEILYKNLLGDFLTYEVIDNALSEEITIDKIRKEYPETSFAALFMEEFIDNPTELQMVYQLIADCKE